MNFMIEKNLKFNFGPDTQDAMNHRIKHGVDYFHNIQSVSDDDAVKLSRSLGIDIAIDLTGRFSKDRNLFQACCPNTSELYWLPGTMG